MYKHNTFTAVVWRINHLHIHIILPVLFTGDVEILRGIQSVAVIHVPLTTPEAELVGDDEASWVGGGLPDHHCAQVLQEGLIWNCT